ncbi:uncharacterized protein LOC127262750 [Andrographis paniculata]|uniref:uncharacterized protein LOC127262750 n=1 Tax=Andrographis paniculata TaxID=175694 RepID=UPI0021E89340|nr:uncharacterized protein LOC127262750 [Andrographis paniculata]
MALTGTGGRILCNAAIRTPYSHLLRRSSPPWPRSSNSKLWATPKKLSSRTGKFDGKNRRSSPLPTEEQDATAVEATEISSGEGDFVMPELPGENPDFWEGPQWDAFGFFIQYLWAFGIVFALIACGIAVATYNEGATDFKETPVYKEAIQSRDLLEGPEASDSDVFESNPTEEAPSLE